MQAFESTQFAAIASGPRLIVTGAVHGNETCGTTAIRRVIDEIHAGALMLTAGRVTFVPITNPLAYEHRRRQGDRNLNRRLAPTDTPREFEDHIANWLCPLLAQHEVLLDLHSFHTGGEPFVMVGPENNPGPLEAFTHAALEEALAVRLGVRRIVDGWLDTYAIGVRRRLAQIHERAPGATDAASAQRIDLDPDYGVGTTEYMRRVGGWAFTLECGQHDDPRSPEVAYRAILNTLAHLKMIDAPAPAPVAPAPVPVPPATSVAESVLTEKPEPKPERIEPKIERIEPKIETPVAPEIVAHTSPQITSPDLQPDGSTENKPKN
jgi:predicted deacylase